MSAPRRYHVPQGTVRVEDRIEHSRFITTLGRAGTVAEARAFIEAVHAEFPDATHHCHAYVVGPPGSTEAVASSDAGEPPGTAGRPMLSVLLNSGVGDVVAVATRYFGGVKLGKGGLVRAYSGGVQHALRTMKTVERVDEVDATVVLPYAAVDAVRRVVARGGGRVVGERFAAEVTLELRLPGDRRERIEESIAGVTAGLARFVR
jgi:uncharacterized YigZ family protein